MSNLSCGIIGLPNVGKSTIFRALTKKQVPAENYPFCTIDPNVGVVELYDFRLEKLSELSQSEKIIYASVTFVDIAGLVAGAAQGEGLGNKFLSHIRETDAICHVVRCFEDENITHVSGKIDPIKDIETINIELALSDIQLIDNVYPKIEKQAKTDKDLLFTLQTLEQIKKNLDEGQQIRSLQLKEEQLSSIEHLPFLTKKKMIYVANIDEQSIGQDNPFLQKVREYAKKDQSAFLSICGKIEEEIVQLPKEEASAFLSSMGLEKSGLDRLIETAFDTLGLITFLTTGKLETKAWTIPKNTHAQEAAGKIHTDIKNGFIRAEVVSYKDMIAYKGRVGAREAGKARSEGRNYIVQDGDVILFFHN